MPPQSIIVETLEGQCVYEIPKSAPGQELFNQVLAKLGVRDDSLFGLQYTDSKGFLSFMKMTKKVGYNEIARVGFAHRSHLDIRAQDPKRFQLAVSSQVLPRECVG